MATRIETQATFAHNMSRLIIHIFEEGYWVTMGECYRTQYQAAEYARTGIGIKNSLHCDRLAVDLNIFTCDGKLIEDPKKLKPFGDWWQKIHPHNRAGMFWKSKDLGHYEMNP